MNAAAQLVKRALAWFWPVLSRAWARYRVTFLVALVIAVACGAATVSSELERLAPKGVDTGGTDLFGLGCFGTALFAFPFGLLLLILKRTRRVGMHVLVFSITMLVVSMKSSDLQWRVRRDAFHALALRSQPLISAIDRYAKDHGAAPDSLPQLVPGYLPAIPGTGIGAHPAYEFIRFEEREREARSLWYDLGSRKGKPFPGLWIFLLGPESHAIAVATLNPRDSVINVTLDRLPAGIVPKEFDATRWRQGTEDRIAMSASLLKRLGSQPLDRAGLEELLGKPDGEKVEIDSGWELRVPCSDGLLDWDVFFYWPGGRYPDYLYGGSIERIADWAYVHE